MYKTFLICSSGGVNFVLFSGYNDTLTKTHKIDAALPPGAFSCTWDTNLKSHKVVYIQPEHSGL